MMFSSLSKNWHGSRRSPQTGKTPSKTRSTLAKTTWGYKRILIFVALLGELCDGSAGKPKPKITRDFHCPTAPCEHPVYTGDLNCRKCNATVARNYLHFFGQWKEPTTISLMRNPYMFILHHRVSGSYLEYKPWKNGSAGKTKGYIVNIESVNFSATDTGKKKTSIITITGQVKKSQKKYQTGGAEKGIKTMTIEIRAKDPEEEQLSACCPSAAGRAEIVSKLSFALQPVKPDTKDDPQVHELIMKRVEHGRQYELALPEKQRRDREALAKDKEAERRAFANDVTVFPYNSVSYINSPGKAEPVLGFPDWQKITCGTLRPYYYNEATGESSWDKPTTRRRLITPMRALRSKTRSPSNHPCE